MEKVYDYIVVGSGFGESVAETKIQVQNPGRSVRYPGIFAAYQFRNTLCGFQDPGKKRQISI